MKDDGVAEDGAIARVSRRNANAGCAVRAVRFGKRDGHARGALENALDPLESGMKIDATSGETAAVFSLPWPVTQRKPQTAFNANKRTING